MNKFKFVFTEPFKNKYFNLMYLACFIVFAFLAEWPFKLNGFINVSLVLIMVYLINALYCYMSYSIREVALDIVLKKHSEKLFEESEETRS